VPFGLDALTGTTHNDYVYRTLGADYLAPGRDIGAMVTAGSSNAAELLGRCVQTRRRQRDVEQGSRRRSDGCARLTGTPFRRAKLAAFNHVELGTAFAASGVSDDGFLPRGLRGRTVVTADTFFHPVYVRGRRYRWEGDADWAVGPASLRAEYTRVTDQRLGQGYADQDLPDARYQSGYIGGAYVLRGEKKRKGAVEAVARYERVWFDSVGARDGPLRSPRAETIFPSGERVLTLGVNWTLNRFVKLQFNAIRERVEDLDRSPVPNGAWFWSRVFRMQFVL
jgi:phosphate-selective porin